MPVQLFFQAIAKPASWRDPLGAPAKGLGTLRMEVPESVVHTAEVTSLVSLL
jgi:hypothetical protein